MASVPFLESKRQVTFDWHLVQVQKWLSFDAGRHLDSVLVYAALELRCAIERYIFEFLYLFKYPSLTEQDERRCRSIEGLFALLREVDPFYRKTAQFSVVFAKVFPGVPEITIVDLGYLRRAWEQLSEYCHKQLRPEESFDSEAREFQEKGFKLIDETLSRFRAWRTESAVGILKPDTMASDIRNVYDKYLRGEISEDRAERMLRIIEPVLGTRPPWVT